MIRPRPGDSICRVKRDLILAIIAILAAALSRPSVASDQPTPDQAAIQGSWRFTKIVEDGKDAISDDEKASGYDFENQKLYMVSGGQRGSAGTFKLNPSTTPKQIDLTPPLDDPDKGKVMLGIYELKNDVLSLCLSDSGVRPTEFKSDAHQIIFELQRTTSNATQPSTHG